jgi:hypothetical protein
MPPETLRKIISDNPETELLVHCARLEIDASRAKRIRLLANSVLNWTRLLSLAERNGLIPLLFFHLNRIASDQTPVEHLQELRSRFQRSSARGVFLTAELLQLLKLFERSNIPGMPYKGPALAVDVYRNLFLRQFADLDILVPEADVWQATELLVARGYEPHFVISAKKQADFIRLGYVRLFARDDGRTIVELHWRPAPRFFGSTFETAKLWPRARAIELQGTTVRVPSAEDLVLMLCIHGAKDCWERLEWVCNLAELIRSHPELNWKIIQKRAQETHSLRILAVGLSLAHDLLEVPSVAGALAGKGSGSQQQIDRVVSQVAGRFFSDSYEPIALGQRIAFHLQLKDSLRERLRYCYRLALTTTPVDWEITPLPRSASFLYPVLRGFRIFKKYCWEHVFKSRAVETESDATFPT